MKLCKIVLLSLVTVSGPAQAGQECEQGLVERASFESHLNERFARLDCDGDGFISAEEAKRPNMIRKFDKDGDGRLSLDEYRSGAMARFDAVDTNKDGVVTPEEKSTAFKSHREGEKQRE